MCLQETKTSWFPVILYLMPILSKWQVKFFHQLHYNSVYSQELKLSRSRIPARWVDQLDYPSLPLSVHYVSEGKVVPLTSNKKADWILDSFLLEEAILLFWIEFITIFSPPFSLCLTTDFLRPEYKKLSLLSTVEPFLMTWLYLCSGVLTTFLHYRLSSTYNCLYIHDSMPSTFGKTLLFLLFTVVSFCICP